MHFDIYISCEILIFDNFCCPSSSFWHTNSHMWSTDSLPCPQVAQKLCHVHRRDIFTRLHCNESLRLASLSSDMFLLLLLRVPTILSMCIQGQPGPSLIMLLSLCLPWFPSKPLLSARPISNRVCLVGTYRRRFAARHTVCWLLPTGQRNTPQPWH